MHTNISHNNQLFVLAATARPDLIDPILISPSHLANLFVIPFPDQHARISILKVATRRAPLSPLVDIPSIADLTERFHGSDLVEVCQRAAKLAIRESMERDERMKQEQERHTEGGEPLLVGHESEANEEEEDLGLEITP